RATRRGVPVAPEGPPRARAHRPGEPGRRRDGPRTPPARLPHDRRPPPAGAGDDDRAVTAVARSACPPRSSEDALLYGHDPTERIVALHLTDGRGDTMRLYRRTEADEVVPEDVPFHPFFFLTDVALLRGFPRERFRFQPLDGDGFFRTLVVFPDRAA